MTSLIDLATLIENGALLSDAERKVTADALRQLADAEPLSHRRAHRDNIFRQMATDHFPSLSQRAQSAQIRKAALRYQTSGWRHDQHKVSNPRPLGTIERDLWDALNAYPLIPSDRQMRAILAA